MSPLIQVVSVLVGAILIYISFSAMMRKRITEMDTFIWAFAGLVAIILGLFPKIIMWVAARLGITWPPSLLLLVAIVGLGLIVFRQSTEISELQSKLTDLSMHVSLNKQDADRLQDEILPPHWSDGDTETGVDKGTEEAK